MEHLINGMESIITVSSGLSLYWLSNKSMYDLIISQFLIVCTLARRLGMVRQFEECDCIASRIYNFFERSFVLQFFLKNLNLVSNNDIRSRRWSPSFLSSRGCNKTSLTVTDAILCKGGSSNGNAVIKLYIIVFTTGICSV